MLAYNWDRENCPLYGVAGCPLFRGYLSIEINGRAIGTFRIVRYIVGVRYSGVSVKRGSTVKLSAHRIKGGWIISHGYYLMMFHSRVSDCEAHICGQCLINSRRLHDVIRKGRGLVPRHLSEKLRGVWQCGHTMPCPREIQSIM